MKNILIINLYINYYCNMHKKTRYGFDIKQATE